MIDFRRRKQHGMRLRAVVLSFLGKKKIPDRTSLYAFARCSGVCFALGCWTLEVS